MPHPFPRPALPAVLLASVVVLSPARAADPIPWRADYAAARKEANDAGRPICLQIGTEECFYCKKMDATTFRDPAVTGLLGGQFVTVKIDGNKDTALTKALQVKVYPTTVLAGPDGTIHAVLQGYSAPEAFREQLKRSVELSASDERLNRDVRDAVAAAKVGEYARAMATAQRVLLVGKGRPAEPKAKELVEEIEAAAGDRFAATVPGDAAAAAAVAKTFPGTKAAARAEAVVAAAGEANANLVAAAREMVRGGEYADALDLLDRVARGPADRPEAKAAAAIAAEVRSDPERLAVAARQAAEKAAALQVSLAEAFAAKGENTDAAKCLELALRISPDGRHAERAQGQLTKLRGPTPTVPAVRSK